MTTGRLGRLVPPDWGHIAKYPLTALPVWQRPECVPSPVGINWYTAFDIPVRGNDGRWRVAPGGVGRLGRLRGGHCVCFLPALMKDVQSWWRFYDQGNEGACVGFGCSRAMSLLNRRRYDALWLYHEAQKVDGWPGEDYEGTSVRAGLDVLHTQGHRRKRGWKLWEPVSEEGIQTYRWVLDINDWLAVLGRHGADEVPFLNSWGTGYPHVTWMPTVVMERLLIEEGELAVITDR